MALVTGLSGNEIYCLALKNLAPGELVVGNSVNSMGFLGSMAAGFQGVAGGEIPQVTQAIEAGRIAAFERMVAEARRDGAVGVAGVTSELKDFAGNTEFLFVGSALHPRGGAAAGEFFSSAGDAQELYCHMDAGYAPVQHAFGNIAYAVGLGGGITGALRSLARGEVPEYSRVFNATRHHALERIVAQARACRANAVVGIRTRIMIWHGVHEMLMTGTAARHAALPPETQDAPVTSDLTGEELWAMTHLGYAPIKLLISASIYSLGMAGGLKAAFKAFVKGEISDLTTLIHDAREVSIGRLKSEADALGAEAVIGVKTYIAELGGGLVEFLAVGTAMKRAPGMAVASPALPPPGDRAGQGHLDGRDPGVLARPGELGGAGVGRCFSPRREAWAGRGGRGRPRAFWEGGASTAVPTARREGDFAPQAGQEAGKQSRDPSLLPLREKVSAKPTDEGSRGAFRNSRVRAAKVRRTVARPLIRPFGPPSPARGEGG